MGAIFGEVSGGASVLFVTRKFPPAIGGMETLAHDVWSTLKSQPGLDPRLVAHGGSIRELPQFLVRAAREVWRYGRTHPEGVVLTGDVLLFMLLRPLTALAGIRPATMAMGKDVVWEFPFYRRAVRRLLPTARIVLAISSATGRAVVESGVSPDRTRVVTLGVEVPTAARTAGVRTALLDHLGADPEDVILLTLGRLVRRKGVAWFIREVMPTLPPSTRYVVAGDGDDAEAVGAARSGLADPSRVHLLGRVSDAERDLVMGGCDLFVQPNIRVAGDMEGFGLVAVEASMRGALVVASDLEGLQDAVVPDVTGILVPPEDRSAWTAVLVPLINEPGPATAQAKRFTVACRDRFSRDRMGSELVEMLGLRPDPGKVGGMTAERSPAPGSADRPTTERVTIDEYVQSEGDYVIYSLHKATYEFARPFIEGRKVLDLGCGTGYGTAAIATSAAEAVGVDISGTAVRQASDRFNQENLTFTRISPVEDAPLPFENGSFDVVLSFQVVEHVPDVAAYLAEVRRVLRPGGTFLCVTPEREHRLFPHQRPWNEFHLTEFGAEELRTILRARFSEVTISGMSARPGIIGHELRRYQKMRILSLPFTFPGAPDRLRLAGIRTAKKYIGRKSAAGASTREAVSYDFGPDDIVIGPEVSPSVNIVAVCSGTDPSEE